MRVLTVATYLHRRTGGGWEVLLLRRNEERGPHRWVPAGGRVESLEATREAARREVLEETGLDVDQTLLALDCRYSFERDGHEFVEEAFGAAAPAGWDPAVDPVEHDGFCWCSPEEAARRIAWPENRVALVALAARLDAGG